MAEYIELNATSSFTRQAYIKASSNGYITSVNSQVGKLVSANQNIVTLRTKESQTLGNTINLLDSSFKFSGTITIKAGAAGYLLAVNHQPGDYVQEGEQLAVINDINSFAFVLNLPYEFRSYVVNKNTVELLLPDGKITKARIDLTMPVVDSASQTQNILLKVPEKNLPANLIAKVRFPKTMKSHVISLASQSVLSDDTQSKFWVMKLLDDSTAVKVFVEKGLEISGRTEIIAPEFSTTDRFLLTGNYGLPDTARINIVKE